MFAPPLAPAPQALAQISGLVGSGGLGGGDGSGAAAPPAHVFQSLIYLRKLCSHPLLVLDPAVPQHMQVRRRLGGWVGGWMGRRGRGLVVGLRVAEEHLCLCRLQHAGQRVPCLERPFPLPASCLPGPGPVQAVHKVLGAKQGSDWPTAQAALRANLAHSPKLAALQELLLDAGKPPSRGRLRTCMYACLPAEEVPAFRAMLPPSMLPGLQASAASRG